MDVVAIALAAVLCALTILFVARPFLRNEVRRDDRSLALEPLAREFSDLLEERDRTLAALQELEFDLQSGSISPFDYRRLIGPLWNDAAKALRQLAKVPEYWRAAHETTPANPRLTDPIHGRRASGARNGTSDLVTSPARSARRVL